MRGKWRNGGRKVCSDPTAALKTTTRSNTQKPTLENGRARRGPQTRSRDAPRPGRRTSVDNLRPCRLRRTSTSSLSTSIKNKHFTVDTSELDTLSIHLRQRHGPAYLSYASLTRLTNVPNPGDEYVKCHRRRSPHPRRAQISFRFPPAKRETETGQRRGQNSLASDKYIIISYINTSRRP